jgi:glycosyltransferase involved in cell wall biosynthesis
MKITFINDCTNQAQTIAKYLPEKYNSEIVTRTKGFLSKTLGLTLKIRRANADVYHVFYALQDAYLALKFGKHPLVLTCCGTDIRENLNSFKWKRIARYNLKNADKVLCNQLPLLEKAREYSETAEYFPIPFDPQKFFQGARVNRDIPLLFHPSMHWWKVKENNRVFEALSKVRMNIEVLAIEYGKDLRKSKALCRKLGLNVKWMPKVSHWEMGELYRNSSLIVGNLGVGQLDTIAIEGMACGKPVVQYVHPEYYKHVPLLHENSVETFLEQVETLLTDGKKREETVQKQAEYVKQHDICNLIHRLTRIYGELAKK